MGGFGGEWVGREVRGRRGGGWVGRCGGRVVWVVCSVVDRPPRFWDVIDLNAVNVKGFTPLDLCFFNCHHDVGEMLSSAGGRRNQRF